MLSESIQIVYKINVRINLKFKRNLFMRRTYFSLPNKDARNYASIPQI